MRLPRLSVRGLGARLPRLPQFRRLGARMLRAVGLQRVQTRSMAWAAAQFSRLHDFVFGHIQSAEKELKGDFLVLRGRGRELARNNPIARRYLHLLAENVVGPKGIRLQCQARMRNGDLDQDSNNLIEQAWKDWGKPGNCDVTGTMSFTEIEALAMTTVARDGEAFIRRVPNFDNAYHYAIQFLDADMVDETYEVKPGNGQHRVSLGVEYDVWGRVRGFYMWDRHPNDQDRKRRFVKASEIVHLYRVDRIGQGRGVTWFAPVMLELRQLHGYTEAELVAARTAAAKMGFIRRGPDAAAPDPDQPAEEGAKTLQAEPGIIEYLGTDEHFMPWDPQHPSGNFGPFLNAVLRSIAAGLNVSFIALTGDLTSANYSSARVGSLQERDHYRTLQQWLSSHLHDVIYREWLRWATLGPLKLPEVDYKKFERVVWRPRGWDWVDPAKDVDANRMAIAAGFQSPAEVIAESGNEIEDVYEQIAYSAKLAKQYGITLDYGQAPKALPAPKPEEEKPEAAQTNGRHALPLTIARLTHGRTA